MLLSASVFGASKSFVARVIAPRIESELPPEVAVSDAADAAIGMSERRRDSRLGRVQVADWTVTVPILASSVLLMHMALLVDDVPGRLLGFAPMAFAALVGVVCHPRARAAPGMLFVLLFVATIAISLLRTEMAYYSSERAVGDAVLWLVYAISAFVIFATAPSLAYVRLYARAAIAAPVVYVGINVLMWSAGIENVQGLGATTPASMLGALGIETDRVVFPLALGVNNFGITAAVALAAAAWLAVSAPGTWERRAWTLGTATCVVALTLTDSRIAIAAAVAAALLAMRQLPWSRIALGLTLLSPFVAILAAEIAVRSGVTEAASRSGPTSGDTLSYRLTIWKRIGWYALETPGDVLYGLGAWGHTMSGISRNYAHLFTPESAPWLTAHNFALQTMLDTGIVGLVVAAGAVYVAVRAVAEVPAPAVAEARALLAMLVAFVFVAVAETAPTIYGPESLAAFVLVAVAAPALAAHHAPSGAAARTDRGLFSAGSPLVPRLRRPATAPPSPHRAGGGTSTYDSSSPQAES